ncbi:MAG: phage replisome organizer N-terminal domain-containing protein [bacterium]
MEQPNRNKRYYWLRLKEDFFSQPYIKKLRKIAGGDTYTIIYQKILLLSIKTNGYLIFQGIEKTFEEELSLILDEDVDNIRITMTFMKANKLIEDDIKNKDEFLLPDMIELIGSETQSTIRSRNFRDFKKQQALQCNADATQSQHICNKNATPEKEIELDKDKDLNTKEKEVVVVLHNDENRPCVTSEKNITFEKNKIFFDKELNSLSVSNEIFKLLQDAYPKIDLTQKIKEISVWLIANPETINEINQSGGNFMRFVVKWLNVNNEKNKQIKPKKQNNSTQYNISFNTETAFITGLTENYINILKSKFPAVDIEIEIKKMEAWLLNNSSKRPAKDYMRFINHWLTQKQDKISSKSSSIHQNQYLPQKTFNEIKMQNSLNAVEQVSKEFLKQDNLK